MLGCVVWIILILFIVVCITPWWFLPSLFVGAIFWHILFNEKR